LNRGATLAWAVALLTITGNARAEDPSLDELLNEKIVVTASRTAEAESAAPATVSSISSDELRRYGIRDLAEAVNFLSLGMFAQPSPLDGQDFGARGVALPGAQNAHILLLLDGHILNDQLNAVAGAAAYGGLPLDLVDHIEVVLGPGSVLYGANAMLGVINVVTKRAGTVSGTHVTGEAFFAPPTTRGRDPAHGDGYPADSGHAGRVALFGGYQLTLFGAPAEATFELEYAHRSLAAFSYSYPFGRASASGTDTSSYDLPSAFARLSVGDVEISVRGARMTRDTTTPPAERMYIVRDGIDGPPRTSGLDQWLNIDAKYSRSLSSKTRITARVFGDVGETRRATTTYDSILWCDVTMAVGCRFEAPVASRVVGAELQTSVRWTNDGSLATLLGVIGQLRHIEGAVNYFDLATGGATTYSHFLVDELNAAAYVQQVWAPAPFLDLNLGLRFDHEERFGDKLSPRVAAALKPWAGGALKAIYSEAFRGPSIRESFLSDPSGRLPAPTLNPESVRSAETTFEQHLGKHRLMTGIFRTWWTDLVDSRSFVDLNNSASGGDTVIGAAKRSGQLFPYVASAVQYQNVSTIDNYGVEVAYDGSAVSRRLTFGMNATLARAYRGGGTTDTFLPTAPVLVGNAHVAYEVDPRLLTVGLASWLIGERYVQSAYAAVYPTPPKAPAQLELRLTATGEVPGAPRLRYRVSGGYAVSGTTAYGATLPPVYQNGPQAPLALNPVERYMALVGLDYEF
jgi:outer membrane receptor for ferrienterochelin and colicins